MFSFGVVAECLPAANGHSPEQTNGEPKYTFPLSAWRANAYLRSAGKKVYLCAAILSLAIVFDAPSASDAKTRPRAGQISTYDHVEHFVAEAAARFSIPTSWIRAVTVMTTI